LIVLISRYSFAQDPHFSQFTNNLQYYNPAYTGLNNGLNINLSYRRQWPGIPGRFETFYLGMDKSLWIAPGVGGLGLTVMADLEGEGGLKMINIGLPLSSRIQLSENWIIQVSLMPSIIQVSVDWSKLVFSDQLNPYYGAIYPTSFSYPDYNTVNVFDISVGGVIKYESFPQRGSEKFNRIFNAGFAVYHTNSPNISLSNLDAPLPRRYVFYGTYIFPLSKNFYRRSLLQLEPAILLEFQSPMSSYTAGVNFHKSKYHVGLFYRNRDYKILNIDAMVFSFGYSLPLNDFDGSLFMVSYSYDFTLSDLRDAGGSHELMLNFILGDVKLFKKEVCKEEPGKMKRLKRKIKK